MKDHKALEIEDLQMIHHHQEVNFKNRLQVPKGERNQDQNHKDQIHQEKSEIGKNLLRRGIEKIHPQPKEAQGTQNLQNVIKILPQMKEGDKQINLPLEGND